MVSGNPCCPRVDRVDKSLFLHIIKGIELGDCVE